MTLTVITIAKEPLPILHRFLDWHLGQGADRIILFLDDPEDDALAAFADEPRIDMRPCTPGFWKTLGLGPDKRFTRRQNAALTAGYHEVSEGWVLILDADELMWFPGMTLAEAIRTFPADIPSVRVATAEQVFLDDGTEGLRLPIPREAVNRLYGADADLFRGRFGLVGHPEGKSFHRAGIPGASFKMHWGFDSAGDRLEELTLGPRDGGHLVHFGAPTYENWRAKMEWRTGSWGFTSPVKEALRDAGDDADAEAAYRALYDKFYRLDADMAARLEAEGGLLRAGPPARGI
ncbi:glycosyltransferase family 2 protein [Roseibacterium beibuensis]|uniref:Glycosyl transferase family 2 n=1 Tax=[Roseibacterium] beibuensis TaxID=1193142 RepID=A0ABP9KTV1_9RHOB|nr:glycosyltransferase family 2 protein [Roseibacterium beibuensis]MCS6622141.1 glycosyltransferase family 2 protein [Roseibacterium beibuensis]